MRRDVHDPALLNALEELRSTSCESVAIAGILVNASAVYVAASCKRTRFSQPEFARLVSYSTRAEAGKALDAKARRKVTEIDRLTGALAQLMPSSQVGDWLRQENDAFGGRPPLALIERGEWDRLWQMIHQIDANIAT